MSSFATSRASAVTVLAVAVFLAIAPAAVAQEPPPVELTVRTTLPEEGPAEAPTPTGPALELSLDDAVAMALERNLGLLVERYGREQAELDVMGNLSIYDLRLGGQLNFSDSEQATFSTIESTTSESRSLALQLTQLTPQGGELSATFFNARRSNELQLVNPSFNSDLSLSFSQPLLRNFGSLITERGLRVARLSSEISREQFERQVAQTVEDVETAYWGLIDAREQLDVAHEALALAEELHERNKIEVEVGTRAPLELIQSEATIALREEEIIQAEAALGDAQDRLRQLLNLPGSSWDIGITPVTEAEAETVEIDLEGAIDTAFAERPELAVEDLNVDIARLDAEFFRRQKRPALEIDINYGLSGASGRGELPLPGGAPPLILDQDLFDAIEQVLDRDSDRWSASLLLSYPLQNRSARASSAIADIGLERARMERRDLEQQILTEVRAAVRQVNTAIQQITSARVSRRLQERNLEAEQKRYENGMSTSFQVAEIQEDLTQARSREVNAITSYRIALAQYYRSIGRLLEESGIELVDDVEDY